MAGVSLVAGLAIAEGVVRWLRPQMVDPYWRDRLAYYRHDPELGWSHVPGAQGELSRQEFHHLVRINAAGWRDRERRLDKEPGVFRIVALGDSFTFGHGVADDEIFTRRLETLMPGVEVLNMALSGSSTDQQLLILKTRVRQWHPDMVLVMVCRNDFTGILSRADGPYGKPAYELTEGGGLRLVNVPVPPPSAGARLHAWLRRSSGLVNLAETAWETGSAPAAPAGAGARETSYALMRALLSAMHQEATSQGARFVIGLVPSNAHTYFDEVPAAERRRFEVVKQLAEAERIPLIDLVPAFRRAARDPVTGARIDLHYRLDQHWNRRGHEVAATEMARRLAALP